MTHRPHRCLHRKRAFTLIEVLVVVAIIGVLLSMLLPALGTARRRGYKAVEMNRIKHLGHAWMLYANNNNGAALPGFLEKPVQERPIPGVSRGWGVVYKFPDQSAITLTFDNVTGPWTWRLLSYLGYDHSLVHGHLASAQLDKFAIVTDAKRVAFEPAFGYNGYYIGGWWHIVVIDGVFTPRYRFYDHCTATSPQRAITIPMVVSQVRRASEMVTFCSSAKFDVLATHRKGPDTMPGWHMVMPPMMEQTPQWQPHTQDPAAMVDILYPGAAVPIARYSKNIAVLYADGHVDEQGYNALYDQRKWIGSAEATTFTHAPCAAGQ